MSKETKEQKELEKVKLEQELVTDQINCCLFAGNRERYQELNKQKEHLDFRIRILEKRLKNKDKLNLKKQKR